MFCQCDGSDIVHPYRSPSTSGTRRPRSAHAHFHWPTPGSASLRCQMKLICSKCLNEVKNGERSICLFSEGRTFFLKCRLQYIWPLKHHHVSWTKQPSPGCAAVVGFILQHCFQRQAVVERRGRELPSVKDSQRLHEIGIYINVGTSASPTQVVSGNFTS